MTRIGYSSHHTSVLAARKVFNRRDRSPVNTEQLTTNVFRKRGERS
ncbi:MAG: hypothetical protein ACPGO3_15410 [Magnetospiraceae bacterium]